MANLGLLFSTSVETRPEVQCSIRSQKHHGLSMQSPLKFSHDTNEFRINVHCLVADLSHSRIGIVVRVLELDSSACAFQGQGKVETQKLCRLDL